MRIGIIGTGNMGATLAAQHPQHAQPSTAVHPSGRTGVRFVLANPSDPGRLEEFSDWYHTYSAAITVPGYLANDVHFENPDASGQKHQPALRDDLRHRRPRPRDRLARHRALTRLPHPPVQRPARQAGLPGTARLLRPRRLPAPAGPARPAHRHPRHPLQRRRRHRAPAPGGPDPADGPVLLRRPIPAHRRIPRARRMARDIRDRRPRPPPRLPASDQPHAARTADPAPTEPVVPPGQHRAKPMARELISQIALAWLLAVSAVTLPIPGTASPAHLEDNLAAAALQLGQDEIHAITAAAGGAQELAVNQ